jgi:two-component system, chemotaxis family, chemotaxis protein CheY
MSKNMRFLVAEDDFTSRMLLQTHLSRFGRCDVVVNGKEAVAAFRLALKEDDPYELLCLDIMMPEMDGQEALRQIRQHEKLRGVRQQDEVKIVMTTALDSPHDVFKAYFNNGCTSYIVKPISSDRLFDELRNMGVIA